MRTVLTLALLLTGVGSAAHSQASPPGPEAFGSLPRIYDAAISPTGKQVALIRVLRGEYVVQIVTLGETDEQPRLVGLESGVKPINLVWANPKRLLVSFWQSEKFKGLPYTTGYIYSLNIKTGKGKLLIKPRLGQFRQYNHVVVDYLEDDPKNILMAFSPDDNNLTPDLRKVNVATGRSKLVTRGKKNI